MAAHSVIAPPSGAAAWKACAMWPTMNARYPQGDTPESLEGSAAHWVAWEVLAGRPPAIGAATPYGPTVTAEMLEGAEVLVNAVWTRAPYAMATPNALQIERPVQVPAIHPDCWGTPDIWLFERESMTLEVVDYKFGHRYVEEFENDQCTVYVAGLLDVLSDILGIPVGELDRILRVNVTIVQPRCYYRGAPVRTWSFVASDIRGHVNQLRHAAELASMPNPRAVTNPECEFCPGRHACAALQRAAYAGAEVAVQSPPVELSPEAASLELRMLERAADRLQARVDGLREAVKFHALRGAAVPFHKLESSPGRQVWTIPPEQVIAMGQLFGVNLGKPATVTPKQAMKLGVDGAVINAYSNTPSGSLQLVPTNPADARKVFGLK